MICGVGLGLRSPFVSDLLNAQVAQRPGWLEIVAENYLTMSGPGFKQLECLAEQYPVVLHCLGMSIGSSDAIDEDYLQRVKRLAQHLNAAWISDHLCWTSIGGWHSHELLPLPRNLEVLDHVVARLIKIQQYLEQTILIENVSSYIEFEDSSLSEADFLAEVLVRSGCDLLLDVNNLYVNSVNHGFDASAYLTKLPCTKVRQLHMAGHSDQGNYLLDDHGAPACDAVLKLYRQVLRRFGFVPTLLERDNHLPSFDHMMQEVSVLQTIFAEENKHRSAHATTTNASINA